MRQQRWWCAVADWWKRIGSFASQAKSVGFSKARTENYVAAIMWWTNKTMTIDWIDLSPFVLPPLWSVFFFSHTFLVLQIQFKSGKKKVGNRSLLSSSNLSFFLQKSRLVSEKMFEEEIEHIAWLTVGIRHCSTHGYTIVILLCVDVFSYEIIWYHMKSYIHMISFPLKSMAWVVAVCCASIFFCTVKHSLVHMEVLDCDVTHCQ